MGDFKRFNKRDSSKRFDKDIERRDSGRSGRKDFERRDSPRSNFEKRMFRVTCDKCGISCEVPFNPTEGKPVYCSNCFKRNDSNTNFDRKQPNAQTSEKDYSQKLEEINEKLDRILEALEMDD